MYIYICIYIYMYTYIYTHIYTSIYIHFFHFFHSVKYVLYQYISIAYHSVRRHPHGRCSFQVGSTTSRVVRRCLVAHGTEVYSSMCGVPYLEVPQNGWFIMKNYLGMDDLLF